MSDTDGEAVPELLDDRTVELIVRLAKGLVVVVYAVVTATFVLLTLGFFLRVTGASPEATFVDWVYRTTERTMQPFRGMFPISEVDGRSVFDASLLFAAAFYGFVAIGLHAVVAYLAAVVRRYQQRQRVRAARGDDDLLQPGSPVPTDLMVHLDREPTVPLTPVRPEWGHGPTASPTVTDGAGSTPVETDREHATAGSGTRAR